MKKKATKPARKRKDLGHINRDLRPLARAMGRLRPDPHNVRQHDDRNVDAIRQSLEQHGQQKPIVLAADGRTVVAGSGTLMAARALEWSWIAAVRFDRDDDQAPAYAVSDNRTAELATWDTNALAALLRHYDDVEGGRAMLPGWSAADIQLLLPCTAETTEDETPDPPAAPVSRAGEVYELGRHRLMCGESTEPDTVQQLLGEVMPFLMVTDPPYGVALDQGWRDRIGVNRLGRAQDDHLAGDDDGFAWLPALGLVAVDVAYVWHPGAISPVTHGALLSFGLEDRARRLSRPNKRAEPATR